MSNKERLSPEECQERKDKHLDRTIRELGYEEITQQEYRKLHREDPVNYHSYTIRVKHKYYKKKTKINNNLEEMKIKLIKQAEEYFKELCKEEIENE
jgi:hypothetical protein